MEKQEYFFDSKMIANLLIALALLLSAAYYISNAKEIEDEVNTVIVSSLKDVSNSLAEQETTRK
ncbi:MAG: hypothetical protein ABJO28_12485 [Maribacter dokdonensis]|uniref:Uncharacterized protein n=1 Tax=Maribacter dokdonensis TaxID=320912 RepID=A0A1H4P5D7_9FLAO|nr:hypothetical protein [Maribacter dokdonensis]KSA14701.1 hypothetical protein I600_1305 [Maribacter dokdonensis DSW-8]CAG2531381.1 hypothetical protein MAR621_01906 [Maribacter dokdonensis]SDS94036.1 hypothetical protein SAMN05192545_2401 [Maribacter dokdonensis]SEC02408.1 hypothetical protein SAMN05192540_2154 [Maribacter dokdonensis]|tara:strand:- start:892 stop:1083 length:192 start_codon:yes stop_codon:yes gene_type:complete